MRHAAAAALLACAALSGAPAALAQTEMRYSHFVAPTHPSFAGLQAWADSLAQATGGKLKVRFFPAEQLGKAKDHYDMVRDGITDAAWTVPGYTPGRFPVAGLLELPFMAGNADGGSLAFDSWYRAYAAREMKDVHYCLGFLQDPGVLHTRKRVQRPEDLRGMKLRSPTVPMNDFFNLLGANSVAIPAPQVREAVERGTIDGAALAWQTAVSLGVTKATPYHLDAPVYTLPLVYVINRGFYDKQAPEVKKAIDAHCTPEWGRRLGADWAGREQAGKAAMQKESGQTITQLSAKDVDAWRQSAAPLLAQWKATAAKSGVDAEQALRGLHEALKRNGAEY